MRSLIKPAALAAATIVLLAACGGAKPPATDGNASTGGVAPTGQVVNVYNWSDYIDPGVIKAFEQESGIKVRYDVFDSNEVLETKLLTGNSGYDVVVPSAYFLERQVKAGVFAPLEQAVIGAIAGYGSLWSVFWLFKLATGKEGMGYGDFKLLAALGAWLGWKMLLPIILFASVVGAFVGVALMLAARAGRSTAIPFGPYLAAAGFLASMYGAWLNSRVLGL